MKTINFVRPATLREWQVMFGHIYNKKNRELYTDDRLLLMLHKEVCKLMELIRKDYRDQFVGQLANIYSWLNGVANRFNVDLQEALWLKFPGICTYCLNDKDCLCGTEHPIPMDKSQKQTQIRQHQRDRVGHEPISLLDHQNLHRRLYGWRNESVVLPYMLASHITEEVGEISDSLMDEDIKAASAEMADVASWIFALAIRLGLNFEEELWKIYPYECRGCHECPCGCKKKNQKS